MVNRNFRNAMGKFATGITIITILEHKEVIGMTVNAFMSVSLDPKLIAISIDHKANMYHKLKVNKQFGLSILEENQKEISMIFAKQMKKDRVIPYKTLDRVPVIDGAIATLACEIKQSTVAGDHKILIAEVTNLQFNKGDPILYFDGKYRTIQ